MKQARKKLLIDLSILKDIHCGLGQIALNYGSFYKDNYIAKNAAYDLYLLVPKHFVGKFGNEVKYIAINWITKHSRLSIPRMDVWHAIHQLSRFIPFYKSTKFILTVHDLNFMYEKHGLKQLKVKHRVEKKIKRADLITCISEFTKQDISSHFGNIEKNIQVIHNGVEDLTLTKPQKPASIKNNEKFFFTIGQVRRKKNFHVLLPMMKQIPDFELYIAGNDHGHYANEIRNQINELGLTNVHLIGIINDNERVWLYRNCHAFLFPSLLEGFGLPVIEAMMFGKPVFSSKETSLAEIGGDRAYFWEDFDANRMKTLVLEKLADFYLDNKNAEANIRYARGFSYSTHLDRYNEIYKQLLFA